MGFGDFRPLCQSSALPLCFVLGPPTTLTSLQNPLLLPSCSARSIEFANTIIFQAATDFAHLAALFMTAIMIFHVRSKFTAVGRKEILTFFYVYVALTAVSLVLDAGVLGASNEGAFLWFVAVQNGLASALCTSLLVNGFVGFQLYEDGTRMSVWLCRLSSVAMFLISAAVSLMTFKGWAGLSPTSTTGLFVVVYVINAICVAVYLVMQVILVINTLQDRWPLWDLAAAVFFFVVGQVILYAVGSQICEAVNHYLDGLFFATLCNLLAVMMIYKYWDSITKEDLEFSVGTKQGNWDLASKDPLLDQYSDLNGPSAHDRNSIYGVPSGRDSLYDTASLDYRPVSHGNPMSMSRGYEPSSTGYGGESRSRDRSSLQYQYGAGARDQSQTSHERDTSHGQALMTQGNDSGNLSLLERRQSYGDNIKSQGYTQRRQSHGDKQQPAYGERRQSYGERRQSRERRQSYGEALGGSGTLANSTNMPHMPMPGSGAGMVPGASVASLGMGQGRHDNRKSMQVHTGVAEAGFEEQEEGRGQGGAAVDDVQNYINEARRQRRESENARAREREYAY